MQHQVQTTWLGVKLGYRWLVSPTGSMSALSRPGLDHLGNKSRTLLIHNIRITLFCFVLHTFIYIYIFTDSFFCYCSGRKE